MPDLTVEHLSKQRLSEAWPLLVTGAVGCIPTWWANESAALIHRGGGVLVARASDGLIHGLATYEPLAGTGHKRVLAVDSLITVELNTKQPTRKQLLRELDLLAQSLGCTNVDYAVRRPVSRADRIGDPGGRALPSR